jgi:hypothetical protein
MTVCGLGALALGSAPAAAPLVRIPETTPEERPMPAADQTPSPDQAGDGCVANLPFARGKSFCCLDDYLAHLEAGGAIDLPWWRRVGADQYERVVRMPGVAREAATRAELMARFGFQC